MNEEMEQMITAYHDGELDLEHRGAARDLIEGSAEARQFLHDLEAVDQLLQTRYAEAPSDPVPVALRDILEATSPAAGFKRYAVPLAIAATLAMVAVLLVRQTMLDGQMRQLIDLQQELAQLRHQALENVPSGTVASWAPPTGGLRAEVRPLRTYRTADRQFCREYEERVFRDGGLETRRGIACREGKALWTDRPAPSNNAAIKNPLPDKGF